MISNVPNQSTLPEEVCDTCGAVGFQELLLTCSSCNITRHLYCTRKPFQEVPKVWLCDSCNATNLAAPCIPANESQKAKNIKGQKTFENSKVKFIPFEEAARATKGSGAVSRQKIPQRTKERKESRGSYHPRKPATSEQIKVPRVHEKQVDTKDLAIVFSEPVKDEPVKDEPVKDFVHSPAKIIIWKGSFDFAEEIGFDDSFYSFCAHPATRIHPKAYLFLKQLPSILHINILPRSNIWSEMFEDICPGLDEIALYFFPNCRRSRRSFVSLLEHMKLHDLALLSLFTASVQLVLFSSCHLRKGSRKISSEHFICGTFRRIPGKGNGTAVDMDIDMHGGHDKKTEILENEIPLKVKLPPRPLGFGGPSPKQVPCPPGFGSQAPIFRPIKQEPLAHPFSPQRESLSQRPKLQ